MAIMLYELVAHDSVKEVRDQLQLLLDRITPFYQDRLNDLPPQERAVLETIAVMRGERKTPATIAARMRMSQPQTSSLLKRLTKSLYLRAHNNPDDKRSRLYTIREGFFDIWLAMNLSRGARDRLPFLVDFFARFYPSHEAREQKRKYARNQARTMLRLADLLFPKKITTECIGDAHEILDRMARENASPWRIQFEALVRVFWASVFSLGELGKLAVIWRLLSRFF